MVTAGLEGGAGARGRRFRLVLRRGLRVVVLQDGGGGGAPQESLSGVDALRAIAPGIARLNAWRLDPCSTQSELLRPERRWMSSHAETGVGLAPDVEAITTAAVQRPRAGP